MGFGCELVNKCCVCGTPLSKRTTRSGCFPSARVLTVVKEATTHGKQSGMCAPADATQPGSHSCSSNLAQSSPEISKRIRSRLFSLKSNCPAIQRRSAAVCSSERLSCGHEETFPFIALHICPSVISTRGVAELTSLQSTWA